MRTKELEVQYNMARYERERKTAEQEMARSRALNAQVLTFSKTETELRSQLNIYVDKFKQVGHFLKSSVELPLMCFKVEDTLNNSNDLFLTFRKEMEDMSKKTKRLEKENMTLSRKNDLTSRNIIEMAEERSKTNQELGALRKKNEKLRNIINQMQNQGRGLAQGMAGTVEGSVEGEYGQGDPEGGESDFESDDDEEEGSDDAEYDEDTEEEMHNEAQKPFGPVPPPPPPLPQASQNGVSVLANGIRH